MLRVSLWEVMSKLRCIDTVSGPHNLRYSRHFANMFLWLRNGDKDHTSSSFSVLVEASRMMGSTKVNVLHVHRLTLSSGHVSVDDGI